MKNINVITANYINGFQLYVCFNDGTSKVIDFGKFLNKNSHPQYNKYKDIELFKKFRIEMGNVVWGESWDLIFPVSQLYKGKISN